jgi:hypothetical protein
LDLKVGLHEIKHAGCTIINMLDITVCSSSSAQAHALSQEIDIFLATDILECKLVLGSKTIQNHGMLYSMFQAQPFGMAYMSQILSIGTLAEPYGTTGWPL